MMILPDSRSKIKGIIRKEEMPELERYIEKTFNSLTEEYKYNKLKAMTQVARKKVYKYVTTYRSKPILVEETGNYIYLETGCYKWVEEDDTTGTEAIKYMSVSEARKSIFKSGYAPF